MDLSDESNDLLGQKITLDYVLNSAVYFQLMVHSVFSGLYPYMNHIHYHIGIKSHKTQQLIQGQTRVPWIAK